MTNSICLYTIIDKLCSRYYSVERLNSRGFFCKMDQVKLLWSKTNRWHRVILVFLIVELRLLPKRQHGFECNDPSLSHPYTGDTISWKWLLLTVALLPLAVLLAVEKIYGKDDPSGRSKQQALCWYKEYLFGVLLNLTVVQTLKVTVGAPRPHFFDTCSPKEALSCTGSEYVSSYTCMKAHWLSQSDTSFPSGHTSLALHTGFFIAYYLHQRALRRSRGCVRALQALSVAGAAACALSRVADRRHHWRDVLAGAALALPILLYTVMSLCKNFDCPNVNSQRVETDEENTPAISENPCDT